MQCNKEKGEELSNKLGAWLPVNRFFGAFAPDIAVYEDIIFRLRGVLEILRKHRTNFIPQGLATEIFSTMQVGCPTQQMGVCSKSCVFRRRNGTCLVRNAAATADPCLTADVITYVSRFIDAANLGRANYITGKQRKAAPDKPPNGKLIYYNGKSYSNNTNVMTWGTYYTGSGDTT